MEQNNTKAKLAVRIVLLTIAAITLLAVTLTGNLNSTNPTAIISIIAIIIFALETTVTVIETFKHS